MELCIVTAGLRSGGLPCPRPLERFERATLIAERFGGLDEGLVSRDGRAIQEKIETDPKIRKWFQDLTRLSSQDLTITQSSLYGIDHETCRAAPSFFP
jgi:hypothetical protein